MAAPALLAIAPALMSAMGGAGAAAGAGAAGAAGAGAGAAGGLGGGGLMASLGGGGGGGAAGGLMSMMGGGGDAGGTGGIAKVGEQPSPDVSGAPGAAPANVAGGDPGPGGGAGGAMQAFGSMDPKSSMGKPGGAALQALMSFSAGAKKETAFRQKALLGSVGGMQSSMMRSAHRTGAMGAALKPIG